MNISLANVYRICNTYSIIKRNIFDECVLRSIFSKEKMSEDVTIEPLLYLICRKDEEAKKRMDDIDIDMSERFFRNSIMHKMIFTYPDWIEDMVGEEFSPLVYEIILNMIPPGGIVRCTEEDVTIRFLTLLWDYWCVIDMYKKNKQKSLYGKNVFKNIFLYVAHNMGINDTYRKKKKIYTKNFEGHTNIYRYILLLHGIDLAEFAKCEGKHVYFWYKVAYDGSEVDWENLEDEDERYVSGFF